MNRISVSRGDDPVLTYLVDLVEGRPCAWGAEACYDTPRLHAPAERPHQTRRPRQSTKRINLRQARCLMEGLSFAHEIGAPLNAHLIIHWGGTLAGDDADGKLFARFRYLLDKRSRRKFGTELTAIWIRERHRNKRMRQQSEVVHSHLLFHLPPCHRVEALNDVEELVTLVARGIVDDRAAL